LTPRIVGTIALMSRTVWNTRAPASGLAALLGVLLTAGALETASAQTIAAAPVCPQVDAVLGATIDTKVVKAGDRFRFTTRGPVEVDGMTIAAGTTGLGLIATLDHSKSQGHSGYLVLEARYLELPDGSHVPVTFRPAGDGRSDAFVRAGSSDAGLLGYLPFYIGTATGVYNTFHHGKDAAVVAGTVLPLIVGDAFYAGTCSIDVDQR
jgi:hypothetical protein